MIDQLPDLEQRLQQLRPPAPADAMLDRIMASRDMGTRIPLPTDGPPPPRRLTARVLGAALVAAGVAGVLIWTDRPAAPNPSGVDAWDIGWLGPASIQAQAPDARFGAITQLAPLRMRTGRWSYARTTHGDGGYRRDAGTTNLLVTSDTTAGTGARWLIVVGRSWLAGSSVDSLTVAASDLRPLARALHRSAGGGGRTFQLTPDSIIVRSPQPALNIARALPAMASTPYLMDLDALLPVLPLAPRWAGRVDLLQPFATPQPLVSLGAEVVGEESVTVPAGTFRCFKVAFYVGRTLAETRWVDMEDGRMVRRTSRTQGGIWDEDVLTFRRGPD